MECLYKKVGNFLNVYEYMVTKYYECNIPINLQKLITKIHLCIAIDISSNYCEPTSKFRNREIVFETTQDPHSYIIDQRFDVVKNEIVCDRLISHIRHHSTVVTTTQKPFPATAKSAVFLSRSLNTEICKNWSSIRGTHLIKVP